VNLGRIGIWSRQLRGFDRLRAVETARERYCATFVFAICATGSQPGVEAKSRGRIVATTLVRVREDIRATLQQLAQEESVSMQEILARAVEEYRRARIFERANEAYAALRADPEAWEQELEEQRAWEVTLMEGINPESSDRVPLSHTGASSSTARSVRLSPNCGKPD
jgi:hypothetical protein